MVYAEEQLDKEELGKRRQLSESSWKMQHYLLDHSFVSYLELEYLTT